MTSHAVHVLPSESPATTEYMAALNASMDAFIEKEGQMYMSALRQAFLAGAQFQLRYKPQEK